MLQKGEGKKHRIQIDKPAHFIYCFVGVRVYVFLWEVRSANNRTTKIPHISLSNRRKTTNRLRVASLCYQRNGKTAIGL